jgi:hypothetical protein
MSDVDSLRRIALSLPEAYEQGLLKPSPQRGEGDDEVGG